MILSISSADFVSAQESIVFPAKGQTPEQTEKEKSECYGWAKQQAGFDPMQPQQPAPAASTQSQPHQGQRLRGAARGAAMGAVVGEIANDDAGQGAAAGAAAGAMAGGMKKRDQARQQAQAQQQKTATARKQSDYNRAFSACMEGKGCTVI